MSEPADPLARSSVDPFFRPRSVVVVGASRQKQTIGYEILHNLLTSEFAGEVAPVNPAAPVVHSLRSYPSVEDVPGPVDLAVLVVPSRHAIAAAESCGRKGVRALIVITAGFKEVGEDGARLERQLVDVARRYGMRIVGPNCMGIINTDPAVNLQATFSATRPLPGNIAFSSQSGALGEAVLALTRDLGLGLSSFVSLGNKADVSGNDLIEYWEQDPRTKVILMYVESFGNPARFVQIARRVARTKPILAVKAGRTEAGARAAASHTGSLAGADIAAESLLAQAGVIRASSIEELFVYASALSTQPIPRGNRVAIVTNSGGPGILATDACVQTGLEIAALTAATQSALRAVLPPEASAVNPVDMIASAGGPSYEACLRAVAADDQVDALITIFTSLEMFDNVGVARGILRGIEGCRKPVLVVFMGKAGAADAIGLLKSAGLPVFTFPEDAVSALKALVRYRTWLDRPEGTIRAFADLDRDAVATVLDTARRQGRRHLTLAEALRVVAAAGIPLAAWGEAGHPGEAAAIASRLGFPVALKVSSSRITHKSEAGGVRLHVADAQAVREAAHAMLRGAHGADPEATIVVQRMTPPGHEVILGASTDPKYGPLLMFGLGGIFVEILKDVIFRIHPLTDVDAGEMVRSIRAFPILDGARGGMRACLPALEDALQRVSALLTAFPEIHDLDVNPFMAGASAAESVAVDARVALAPINAPTS